MYRFMEEDRAVEIGKFVLETGATVRAAAGHFGISKSTVHKDLTYRLRILNPSLFNQVNEILQLNKSERHLRGGEATRQMYLRKKEGRNARTPIL